jgi:hypothetical protein
VHSHAPVASLIEQQSLRGHDDRIERPAGEAVPLFWRFMIEKFGVHPAGHLATRWSGGAKPPRITGIIWLAADWRARADL